MSADLKHVVVVGASAAGLSAADGLREGGFTGSITVLGAERTWPYDRPSVSKDLLVNEGEPELLTLRSAEHLTQAGIDLLLGESAVGLDVDKKYVVTDNGKALPWDAVVIACGSKPRSLLTEDGSLVPSLRTPSDLTALREATQQHSAVSLIGSGFIGLEVAAGLATRGVDVTIFESLSLPLVGAVGPEVAQQICDLHAQRGVRIVTGAGVESIAGTAGDYEIRLTDGSSHRTPFVLAGVGVEPDTEWLEGSGIELSCGVVTDSAGQTNIPGVWAAGDAAVSEHPLLAEPCRIEHWTHAIEQGRQVGLNIAQGRDTAYAAVPYFWTDQYGRRFHCYGRRRVDDISVIVEGSFDDDEYLVAYGQDGHFHAVFSCGRVRSLRGYRKLLARGADWNEAMALARQNNPLLTEAAQAVAVTN